MHFLAFGVFLFLPVGCFVSSVDSEEAKSRFKIKSPWKREEAGSSTFCLRKIKKRASVVCALAVFVCAWMPLCLLVLFVH